MKYSALVSRLFCPVNLCLLGSYPCSLRCGEARMALNSYFSLSERSQIYLSNIRSQIYPLLYAQICFILNSSKRIHPWGQYVLQNSEQSLSIRLVQTKLIWVSLELHRPNWPKHSLNLFLYCSPCPWIRFYFCVIFDLLHYRPIVNITVFLVVS